MKAYTTNPERFEWFSHRDSLLPFTFRTFVKVLVFVFVIVTSILVCCSCGSTKVASQTVEHMHKDTVYLSNVQYDSIYIYKDKLTDRTRDTIFVKDASIEYRYKMLRDTVRIVQKDSIPYEVTVIETKEITRPLTFYDRLTHTTFWLVIGALLMFVYFKLRTVFSR